MLTQQKGCGLKVLFNLEAKLVGSRRKIDGKLVLLDLDYTDDMAVLSKSMNPIHLMEKLL